MLHTHPLRLIFVDHLPQEGLNNEVVLLVSGAWFTVPRSCLLFAKSYESDQQMLLEDLSRFISKLQQHQVRRVRVHNASSGVRSSTSGFRETPLMRLSYVYMMTFSSL